jgi:hypothetical protein
MRRRRGRTSTGQHQLAHVRSVVAESRETPPSCRVGTGHRARTWSTALRHRPSLQSCVFTRGVRPRVAPTNPTVRPRRDYWGPANESAEAGGRRAPAITAPFEEYDHSDEANETPASTNDEHPARRLRRTSTVLLCVGQDREQECRPRGCWGDGGEVCRVPATVVCRSAGGSFYGRLLAPDLRPVVSARLLTDCGAPRARQLPPVVLIDRLAVAAARSPSVDRPLCDEQAATEEPPEASPPLHCVLESSQASPRRELSSARRPC